MSTTEQTRSVFNQYLASLNGQVKTPENVGRFVAEPHLAQHILMSEAAFPRYEIVVDQMVVEGDGVALRGAFHGAHTGDLPGMPATGKELTVPAMLFYRIADGRITNFWMQPSPEAIFQQLNT